MLKSLFIQNYALIRQLEVNFSDGFTVITGETGAGKSILLGAIGLLMGQRADPDVLFTADQKCLVEGRFDVSELNLNGFFDSNDLDYDHQCVIRREISQQGKSRAFINDTPVALNILKELASQLIDVHSQHETLLIQSAGFQLKVIDGFIKKPEIYISYKENFLEFTELKKQYDALSVKSQQQKKEHDYQQFLFDELSDAKLIPEENNNLEAEISMLSNAENILKGIQDASNALNGSESSIIDQLRHTGTVVSQLSNYAKLYEDLFARIKSAQLELEDVAAELNMASAKVEFNPNRLELLSDRLDLINRLLHKHQLTTINELIQLRETLDDGLRATSEMDDQLLKMSSRISLLLNDLKLAGKIIHEDRVQAANNFSHLMIQLIRQLGMPHAVFSTQVEPIEIPGPDGMSRVSMLFSANKGGRLLDLGQVASGGELSRVMLSIKSLLADRRLLPTIIFDEIDNGVSGEIAAKVGSILRKMAEKHQLVAITHLPQVAAKGQRHILVYKQTSEKYSETKLRELNDEDRVFAVASMLGDENVSEAASAAARELLNVAK